MARTPEDYVAAIKHIRDYAAAYNGKRSEFYENLYAMLATPIPEDQNFNVSVKKMYLAAVGALTWEIQPPTSDTYAKVVEKLNSVLEGEKLGPVSIAIYPDEGMDDAYRVVGEVSTLNIRPPAKKISRNLCLERER